MRTAVYTRCCICALTCVCCLLYREMLCGCVGFVVCYLLCRVSCIMCGEWCSVYDALIICACVCVMSGVLLCYALFVVFGVLRMPWVCVR